jgi:tetratricopeptide (TPR) repeat protein
MLKNIEKISILIFLILADFSPSINFAFAQSPLEQGEAMLEEIEPSFYGTPIFLNPDMDFKNKVRQKLIASITVLEKAYQESRDNDLILLLLGKAYGYGHDLNVKGSWQKSSHYLEMYIEQVPQDYRAYLYLAKNYMDAERFENAYKLYEKAHELEPKSEAQKFMAFTLMLQGKTDLAIAAMQNYIKTHPHDDYAGKALIAFKDGNFSKGTLPANEKR